MKENLIVGLVELTSAKTSANAIANVQREIEASHAHSDEIDAALSILMAAMRNVRKDEGKPEKEVTCSFCHKSRHETRVIVAAVDANICDECTLIVARTIKRESVKAGRIVQFLKRLSG